MDALKAFGQLPPGFYWILITFALIAGWEGLRPALPQTASTPLRWFNNFLCLSLNSLILSALFPMLGVALAIVVAERDWGLLSWITLPVGVVWLVGLVCLDVAGYGMHRLLHKSALLWRLHAVHHSDVDFDCTTGFRFHPLEGVVNAGARMTVIVAMGVPASVVAAYEFWTVLLNLYGHANARQPARLEKVLRWLVVTPEMHRVHHSVRPRESLCNYGVVLPWWDRLFGTYLAEPEGGHAQMKIGLDWWRGESLWSVPRLLILPFAKSFPTGPQEESYLASQTCRASSSTSCINSRHLFALSASGNEVTDR